MEGEVIYTVQGAVPMSGRLHGTSRIYTTSASDNEVKEAIESAADTIRSLPGLVRYTVAKLTDCGPLANSRFHHRPVARHQPPSKLEAAYRRADKAIQQIVDLLAA